MATIHLAQMLYIWPYIAFFSWPALLPTLLPVLLSLLPQTLRQRLSSTWRPSRTHLQRLPRLSSAAVFTILALFVVHFNTIVHPFTLADNRHYTFYVFRILRRHPAIKYLAAPVYVFLGWTCIMAMGNPPTVGSRAAAAPGAMEEDQDRMTGPQGTRISAVVLWLAVCTLCLATAPLVEPRYFILPWIVWRLHVPPPSALHRYRWYVLGLEVVWFMAIHHVIRDIFLNHGFEWVGIEGEKGKIQRFMW